MLTETRLECQGLSKFYGKGNALVKACEDISFSAASGSITGLLGLNGAGKSTLLSMLSGILMPDKGSVILRTEKQTEQNDLLFLRKNTGFVSELPFIEKNLSVEELLFQEASLFGIEQSKMPDLVNKALTICQLEDKRFIKVNKLSKGYIQRVNLSRALCHDPKVLILDEFSAGLDPSQTVKLRRSLKELAENKIIIISTHNIFEAEELCQKIYVLGRGKILASGSIENVIKESGKTSLEEAFLTLTGEE